MKKSFFITQIVYIFLFVCGSVYAVGERTISLGAGSTWKVAENRTGITEASAIRPHPVLLLSSSVAVTSASGYQAASGVLGNFSALTENALDLYVSFDEKKPELFRDNAGNYKLSVPPEIELVDRVLARSGAGAALFGRYGNDPDSTPIVIQPDGRNALFAPENRIKDFTIEFWMYPLNMENGEQILSWTSTMPGSKPQRIDCSVSKNKLKWSFINFFTPINGSKQVNIDFTSLAPIVPKTWSHHLVRFDAATGMLEYIVDGKGESIVYATITGRENSEVHIPVVGANGRFLLGGRFSGFIDEFKIHSVCAGRSSIQRYSTYGGRIETKPVDLGAISSGIIKINACGGRTSIRGIDIHNEFRENGRFKFSDDAEMNFFVRAGENPYSMDKIPWVIFTPGSDISGVRGRYVQIAVDFYPSADGESSPYLEQLNIVFMRGEAPLPPRNLTAIAKDGSVQLRWKQSPTSGTAGYLVYYSAVREELFGNDSSLGPSPIDVGSVNSVNIDGLKNGTLYYFRVAAYDMVGGDRNIGDFSAEVTARPLMGLK